ncbi:transposase for insertion sequence element, partial [Niallia nealsonii AAU1]
RLRNKRHFLYEEKEPFWEAFETFLQNHYAYDPTQTLLIINGDGAGWITACREYFRERAFFTMDRFHVARSMKQLMKSHPRYRYMKRALKNYQVETLLLELNSAVGTMDTPEEEEKL